MRYYTHSGHSGKIKGVQNDLQTFYAIKFQGQKSTNLSLNPGCETSSTLLPNYSFEHATHRAVMLYESLLFWACHSSGSNALRVTCSVQNPDIVKAIASFAYFSRSRSIYWRNQNPFIDVSSPYSFRERRNTLLAAKAAQLVTRRYQPMSETGIRGLPVTTHMTRRALLPDEWHAQKSNSGAVSS